jgi:hypothetical protein
VDGVDRDVRLDLGQRLGAGDVAGVEDLVDPRQRRVERGAARDRAYR